MTPTSHIVFRALGDPTRQAILDLLRHDDMTIAAVAERFDMTRPAVKKHLRVLEEGRLITVVPQGRARINKINPEGFAAVESWLETFDRFWDDRLSALTSAAEKDPTP